MKLPYHTFSNRAGCLYQKKILHTASMQVSQIAQSQFREKQVTIPASAHIGTLPVSGAESPTLICSESLDVGLRRRTYTPFTVS